MKDTDIVDLIILAEGSSLAVTMTRKLASEQIREFYEMRETARTMSWWKFCWFIIKTWKRPYTFYCGFGSIPIVAIDSRKIVGMLLHEKGASSYEKIADAQKTIAEAIKKEQKERNRGDEWRDGPQGDDE